LSPASETPCCRRARTWPFDRGDTACTACLATKAASCGSVPAAFAMLTAPDAGDIACARLWVWTGRNLTITRAAAAGAPTGSGGGGTAEFNATGFRAMPRACTPGPPPGPEIWAPSGRPGRATNGECTVSTAGPPVAGWVNLTAVPGG